MMVVVVEVVVMIVVMMVIWKVVLEVAMVIEVSVRRDGIRVVGIVGVSTSSGSTSS